ncbi:hypothetical protein [Thalassotalea ganghwensis]
MSIITADNIEIKEKHRSLIFEGVGAEQENLSLFIYDYANPKNKQGAYKIPLYQAKAQQPDSDVADIELVNTYPLIFDTIDKTDDQISPLPQGYVYIFVDGYLWRELKVIVDKFGQRFFSDVNLAYQKGFLVWKTKKNAEYANQGRRDATCEKLRTILVPNKLKGQQCKVEMAYSEQQWSWTQILKLGGMNPEDPRLNYGDPLSKEERLCPDKAIAAKARSKRMQVIDNLSDFENGFTRKGLIKTGATINKNISHFAAQKLAPVVLTNGLHVARNTINAILTCQLEIAATLHHIKGVTVDEQGTEIVVDAVKKAKFELAEQMINRFFQMNDAILDGDIKVQGSEGAEKAQQKQVEYAEKIKAWREDGLDLDNLRDYLHYDKLLALSTCIKDNQLVLAQLIEQDIDVVKFKHCIEDFTYHRNAHYAQGIDVLKDIAVAFKQHPANQYSTIILDKKDWDELETKFTTSSTLLKLLGEHPDEPFHPIAELFFAKEPTDQPKPGTLDLEVEDHQDPFNPKFSLERVLLVEQDESFDQQDQEAVMQIGRRLSQALMGLSTGLLDLSLIASANQGQAQTVAGFNQQIQQEKQQSLVAKQNLNSEISAHALREKELKAKLANAEQELAQKTKHLNATDAEYQRQHLLAKPEIEQLKKELGEIDSKLAKAQKSLRQLNNQLVQLEVEIAQKGSAHLSKNKGLISTMRVLNQLEDGQFTALEMTAQDYKNGKYAEGFIALDARARAEIAQELGKEIRDLVRAQNNSRTRLATSQGTVVDTVDDVMHMRSNINRLLAIAEQAQTVLAGEGASGLKLQVIALKDSEKATHLKKLSLQDEIKQLNQGLVNLSSDFDKNAIANQKLAELAKQTETLANQKFLSNTSINGLTRANIGILGAVGLFEVYNLTMAINTAVKQPNGKNIVYALAGVADFAAVIMTLTRESYVIKVGHPSPKQLANLVRRKPVTAEVKTWFSLTTWMYRANIAASLFSAFISLFEAYQAFRRGDNDAAFGLATAGIGFAVVAISDKLASNALKRGLNIGSRAGWIGLLIVLVGVVIYYCFKDEDIERWFKVCPWGTDAGDDDNSATWLTRPDYAFHDLAQKLFAPQVQSDNVLKITNSYSLTAHGQDMVHTYEDPTEAYFIVSCPTSTAPEHVAVEFAVKPKADLFDFNGNDEHYRNIILGKAVGQGQPWLQAFWDNITVTSLSGGQGLRLDLNQFNCAPLFKKFNTTALTFRLRLKTYPKGKGVPVSASFTDNEYKLPISERDDDGTFTDAIDWQSAEVNLSLRNRALKQQLGLI